MSEKPSYVILGGGAVTREFYLPALALLGLADRTTVVDPSPPSSSDFPGVRFVAQDHRSFLKSLPAGDDARVIIALPNFLHVEAAEIALAAGRHVLCEKPLALKAAECARLAELAAKAGRQLKVAMSRRYIASLTLARQMATNEELGKVLEIEVRDCSAFLWRPLSFTFFARETGGVLADMGVHYLDWLDSVVGPMKPVAYADDARGGTESSATFTLKAGKIPVSLRLSRLYSAGAFIRLICERGEIVVDKADLTSLRVLPRQGAERQVTIASPFEDPAWPSGFIGSFCQMLRDFERAIAGETPPVADVADAVRATTLIEWAYDHRPAGRAVVLEGKPTALVTGATGFIGGHLVERLTGSGEVNVRITARSPASCANVTRFPVDLVPTDLTDPASVAAAMRGVETVYHLAFGKGADASRVTIEGTKNVVEAAISAGARRVVVLSTMYVFGFPEAGGAVDETFPYRPYGGEYGESKAQMERWCLERARTSGATRIAVINPTCVFGPSGGGFTILPVDLARAGQFCWVDGGQGLCNYTYVDNVVDAVLTAAVSEQAHGQRFIVNDGTLSWREFYEPMLAPLGREIPSYTVAELNALDRFGGRFSLREVASAAISSDSVRKAAKKSPFIRRIIDGMNQRTAARGQDSHMFSNRPRDEAAPAALPPEWLAELFGPAQTRFSSAKAEKLLGWTPRVGLAEARARTIAWLRESGHLP